MNNEFNIKDSPIWAFEVLNFLLEVKIESEKKVIENHNSFGKTKEEMMGFFKFYCDYKKTKRNITYL